ncbi:MAG TPA: hypothetical protein ENH92_05300 [Ectothiorhodospiraceae bacterium]|nr:hypothetical protein [Ectothiorhodospiraceae bacterium]
MNQTATPRSIILRLLALVAMVFGALTLKSAYLVLFTTGTFHQEAGDFVPFVVTFNGIAGFFYLIAGFGLFKQTQWSVRLSILIAVTTLVVYGLFGLHVNNGELYEMQTVVAMAIRSGLWSLIAAVAWFKICKAK